MRARAALAGALMGVFVGAAASSCGLPSSFFCSSNSECGVGLCIGGGCAFQSDGCPSGLVYGELAPEALAGQCVPVGVDSTAVDETESGEDPTTDTGTSSSSMGDGDGDPGDGDGEPTGDGDGDSGDGDGDPGDGDGDPTDSGDGDPTDSLPDTVIAHYSFDDIAGSTIFDSSGNDFHATMDNSQPSALAIVGTGLIFTTTDRVIVPPEVLVGRTSFTVEFYVQVSQAAALRQFLFYYGNETDTAAVPTLTTQIEYAAGPPKTARVLWTQGGGQNVGLIGSTTFDTGQWRHVAVTFGPQGMKLYVNHFLDDEDPLQLGLLSPNLEWIQIGAVPSGFGGFSGVIDELRFSEGALTPAQMQPTP